MQRDVCGQASGGVELTGEESAGVGYWMTQKGGRELWGDILAVVCIVLPAVRSVPPGRCMVDIPHIKGRGR